MNNLYAFLLNILPNLKDGGKIYNKILRLDFDKEEGFVTLPFCITHDTIKVVLLPYENGQKYLYEMPPM